MLTLAPQSLRAGQAKQSSPLRKLKLIRALPSCEGCFGLRPRNDVTGRTRRGLSRFSRRQNNSIARSRAGPEQCRANQFLLQILGVRVYRYPEPAAPDIER